MKKLVYLLAFILFSSLLFAEDGIVFISETIEDGDDIIKGEMFISDSRMKMKSTDDDDEVTEIIYYKDTKLVLLIDHDDEVIREITKEDLEKLKQKIEEARKSLENLPSGMRKMVEKKMEKSFGAASLKDVVYKKTGKTENINGWNTEHYIGTLEEEKHSEIWTASYNQLDFDQSDFDIMLDFANYMKNAIGNLGDDFNMTIFEQGYDGLPVRTYLYDDDEIEYQTLLKEFNRKNLTDADFTVPQDYDREKLFE